MRATNTNKNLRVNAIAGTYVVTLGFDLPKSDCKGLLGFSIHRTDHIEKQSYYLEGMKAFAETDPGFPAGARYSTMRHPVQGFQWADYSVKPGYRYTYTVTALKGTPALLTEFASTSVEVDTESPANGTHDIYFNRGVAASQEYVRRFGDLRPEDVPNNKAFEWLSRGIYEALEAFISTCVPGKHALRIAAYEFNYLPLLQLIKTTIDSGVDIQIVYDARKKSPGQTSTARIKKAKLTQYCTKRSKGKSYISHNKFIVKLEDDEPVSVWTGGMNFSDGGIFGHSNVAHVVEEPAIAKKFLEYWEYLNDDPATEDLRDLTEELTPIPGNPPANGTTAIFSPRQTLDLLDLYAELACQAEQGLLMTFAFGIGDIFKDVYTECKAPFRLALLEKTTRPMEDGPEKKAEEKKIQQLRNLPENVFAVGDFIRTNKFDGWVKEKVSGLNTNVRYVHNKFMLIDPLGDDPIVIAGSANFSAASTDKNDENMVIIRGNKRVADIYLGEFMRLFSHHSFRESLNWRSPGEKPKPLKTDDSWWQDQFGDTPRSSRRKFFAKLHI